MAKPAVDPKNLALIGLLNRILSMEYTIIIHFPRLSAAFPDRAMRDKMLYLSTASVKHASGVAAAIEKLGGEPCWSFEPFPDEDLPRIFEIQAEKERAVHDLHAQCAGMCADPVMKKQFAEFAREEEWHEKLAQEITSYLKAKPPAGPR